MHMAYHMLARSLLAQRDINQLQLPKKIWFEKVLCMVIDHQEVIVLHVHGCKVCI